MVEGRNTELDSLDYKMLYELELNPRQPASDLASKLGISRTSACQRLRRLLDGKTVRIGALTNALALGYKAMAVVCIKVAHGELYAVAGRLCTFPNVLTVTIAAGWPDIVTWILFADQSDVHGFMTRELGGISGINSTEVITIAKVRYSSPRLFSRWQRFQPYSHPSRLENSGQERSATFTAQRDQVRDLSVDQLDLQILREIERDARQTVTNLAKKLGISRANASVRLRRLLDNEITIIAAFAHPPLIEGYEISPMIGIKVLPKEFDAVLNRVETLPGVDWVAEVLGRYDILVGMMFLSPLDLAHLLGKELDSIPGVLSTETVIGLETMKASAGYLASSYLQSIEQRQQGDSTTEAITGE
ncbi:MAG: Lrp/AsnC family transcriptional regulator [Chloroflexi bacterium]|nr:Lrp/AsnC family transcriptional regulator [Chloroflexota bacterium]